MKLLHLADLHFTRDRFDEAAASMRAAAGYVREHDVDLVCIAGDVWDGPVANTAGARFNDFLDLVRDLADLAPVVMVYGTPSHDTEGSLEVFEGLAADRTIRILRPGRAYFFHRHAINEEPTGADAVLFGVPEPNKKWLLAQAGATGKDASDDAVRASMRALFLGLGGMRKEHPELPCVLLYHGQVQGAKSGTGYAAASGIMATRDDLAMVGADYFALGDIHEPQRLGDMFAYYPGSIYPCNWGETHKAGCNLVTFAGLVPMVDRLPFPHPQRVKLATTWPGLPGTSDYEGRQTWAEITCSREQADEVDVDKQLQAMLTSGALPGSRVTLNVLPTETVRAGAITEKTTLRDKVQVWAENSELTPTASALSKADELERELTARGAAGTGAHLRIDRLVLRGAIGIWKKSRKDEIDLDLHSYGPGVLALVGPNGAGKTTILENLHPWPCMLTRDGALKDHFRLRDSCRDLYVTDERTGTRYRALLNIRADIASGAAEYFLYRDTGAGFEPMPGINGRKEPYEAAVAELFGTLELYLRTAFVTQRPSRLAPDLGDATPGQRKALFGELAGIDYLDAYRVEAKALADMIDSDLVNLEAVIAAGAGHEATLKEATAAMHAADLRRIEAGANAATAELKGKAKKAERDLAAERLAMYQRKADRLAELSREVASLTAEVKAAEDSIALFQDAAGRRGAALADLERIDAMEARLASLRVEKARADAANLEAMTAYQAWYQEAEALAGTLRGAVDKAARDSASAERAHEVAKARLAAPVADTCPTCGQRLPPDRLETIQHAHDEAVVEVDRLRAAWNDAIATWGKAKASLDAIVYPARPARIEYVGILEEEKLQREVWNLDEDALREVVRKADEAAVRIEEAQRRAADGKARIGTASAESHAIASDLDGNLEAARLAVTTLDDELETLRAEYTAAAREEASATATIEAEGRRIAEAQSKIAERQAAEARAGGMRSERDDWRFLERATGPNGVQALELDALAPSIAAVANRLLSEAYGSRYQLEFRTTRIAGKGSKTKQVEDFEIFILDTETGDEQTLDSLSGGEAVWIRKALYDAFGIVRARNTGVQFLTVFLDEADGALDPEARMLYLRMLEAAHREAGRFQTILISHSTEIQAMVEVVNVADLGPRAP